MTSLMTIVLVCVLFQVPLVWSLPVPEPEKAETEIPIVVEEERTVVETSSPTDLPVATENGNREAGTTPENIFSDAALASLLQMVQKSLMMSFAPTDPSGLPFGRIPNSGEVKETILGPGTKLRVVHRTFNPPTFKALAAGQNENKFLQKQMYGSENFSVLHSEFGKKKEESPDVIDVEVPKEDMDDIEALKNNIEKLNSVLE